MRDRGIVLVLLASALTFLASLYLPWETAPDVPVAPNGWDSSFGQPAGLVALALAVGAVAAFARPDLRARLPLARGAFLLGYFALSLWAQLREIGMFEQSNLAPGTVHYGVGTYLGLASAFVAVLAAQVLRRDGFARRPSSVAVLGALLTLGLLVGFVLPQLRVHVPPGASAAGVFIAFAGDTAAIFAAGVALFGVRAWTGAERARERLAVAGATATLTGGMLSVVPRWSSYSWLALGCSLGLVALALAEGHDVRLAVPRWTELTATVGAVVLIAALFLPWEPAYAPNGWTGSFSGLAGGLAVVLVALLILASGVLAVEVAVGIAILVLSTGFTLTGYASLGYGALLGFVGAAGTLVLLGAALRSLPSDRRMLRLAGGAGCLGFLAIAAVPLTGRLSAHLELEAPWRLLWLQMAAVLVGLHLLGRWLSGRRGDVKLVLLPLALTALTALDLVYTRGQGFGWGAGIVVGLCVSLVGLGYRSRTDGSASITSLATSP